MRIICNKCENVIDRNKYIDGKIIEEYENIYGTYCLNCGELIKPLKKISFNEEKKLEMEILKNEMIEKLKKNIQGENKCL